MLFCTSADGLDPQIPLVIADQIPTLLERLTLPPSGAQLRDQAKKEADCRNPCADAGSLQ